LITGNSIVNNGSRYKCLIHLDRLSITFRHLSGSTFLNIRNPDNIPLEQVFNKISLRYNSSPGIGAYYHSFVVYYDGYVVGRLFSGSKLKKPDLQFDFTKELFYSFKSDFWYEVYITIINELKIEYNNINYCEITVDTDKNLVDQFAYYYLNSCNNNFGMSDNYKMRKNSQVHIMNNGAAFKIAGSENEVAIYNKSKFAEEYILDYFLNNDLDEKKVYRIESRINWNYIRYLRNKKQLNISVETLLDPQKLATIFHLSTKHKITFQNQRVKTYDENRNPKFMNVSILDDLPLKSAEIGILNQKLNKYHYKTDSVDESIIRQNYYKFLETCNPEYFRILKESGKVAGLGKQEILALIKKFNDRYKGNRTLVVQEKMDYAIKEFSKRPKLDLFLVWSGITLIMKWLYNFKSLIVLH
jgi:hypothetical protein